MRVMTWLGLMIIASWLKAAGLVDVSSESGVDFVHFNGMNGNFYFVEMTGQGGALFDYDNDGDLDLYLIQGAELGPGDGRSGGALPMDRLYRNDTRTDSHGKVEWMFTDVTQESGIRMTGYGMGVAVGDFDNDGWRDLYVTQYGKNHLLKNVGGERFVDVTDESGTGDDGWGTSATFFDYDRDGLLDLYVVNYVEYDVAANKRCYAPSSRQDYCGPSGFEPQHDRFYRNLGDGRFEEVSDRLLSDYRAGPGLGVIAHDVNGDGWTDLFVANDGAQNQLWLNQRGEKFVDDALFAGVAVNRAGRAEASMGVDAGDFDNDGDQDLFVTHLMGETNTLYVNDGSGIFEDSTVSLGLGGASFPYTAFGTGWFDYDSDGWLDLLVLNGAVQVIEAQAAAGEAYPLKQPNQLFRNRGGAGFEEVAIAVDSPLRQSEVSRGAAFGDLDNDGDTDVVVFNNHGSTRLLSNEADNGGQWLGLILRNPQGGDAVDTRVEVRLKNGKTLWRRSRVDGSYCSSNDPRVLIGLMGQPAIEEVRVHWPRGGVSRLDSPQLGRYHLLEAPKPEEISE